jgi:hypothetical protein
VGILREIGTLRRIVFGAQHLVNRALARDAPAAAIAQLGQEFFANLGARSGKAVSSVSSLPALSECGGSEIEYIREELPKGAVVALTGDSGSGKSTLLTAWARDTWLKQGISTLFLDRENPISIVRERCERLEIQEGPGLRWWGGWLPEEPPLPDAAVILDWVRTMELRPLVIVDSLSAFHGGDQNDAGEMRIFMQRCRRLADMGGTVGVIHHDGKGESAKDYRGSTDFKAAIDVGYHVSNFGTDGLDRLVLRPFKTRIGSTVEITYHYAGGRFERQGEYGAGRTMNSRLATILQLNPGVNAERFEALANGKNITRGKARMFLSAGVASGAVRMEHGVKNAKKYFWVQSKE